MGAEISISYNTRHSRNSWERACGCKQHLGAEKVRRVNLRKLDYNVESNAFMMKHLLFLLPNYMFSFFRKFFPKDWSNKKIRIIRLLQTSNLPIHCTSHQGIAWTLLHRGYETVYKRSLNCYRVTIKSRKEGLACRFVILPSAPARTSAKTVSNHWQVSHQ